MLDIATLKNGTFYISQKPFFQELKNGSFDDDFSLLALSYNAFEEIDLEGEIDGETELLAGLAELSTKVPCTIFCGVTTQIMGLKHISIAVCHKGKLVDIVDRTQNPFGDDFMPSQKIKIFASDTVSVAVLVDTDILIEKNWQKTAPYCDIILGIIKGDDPQIASRAMKIAIDYDVEVLLIDEKNVCWKNKI